MALTIENDTAIHEAGHGLVSYLCTDIFRIELLSMNSDYCKTIDLNSKGGLKGKMLINFNESNFQKHDKMILLCLAGMAADEVNTYENNLENFNYDHDSFIDKLRTNKYSGDYELLKPHLNIIKDQLSVNYKLYLLNSRKLLHEIFTDEYLSKALIGLRNKLAISSSLTLNSDEIISFLDSTKLKNWKQFNWPKVINERLEKYNKVKEISPQVHSNFWKKLWAVFGA